MDEEQKKRFFLSFVHWCQDIGFGGVKEVVIFQSIPLFCNDWHVKMKGNYQKAKPEYFRWTKFPTPWCEFKEFLETSFPQGIIREIKLQNGLPMSWDAPRPNRSSPHPENRLFKAYVLKDPAQLKYTADKKAHSKNERPPTSAEESAAERPQNPNSS